MSNTERTMAECANAIIKSKKFGKIKFSNNHQILMVRSAKFDDIMYQVSYGVNGPQATLFEFWNGSWKGRYVNNKFAYAYGIDIVNEYKSINNIIRLRKEYL